VLTDIVSYNDEGCLITARFEVLFMTQILMECDAMSLEKYFSTRLPEFQNIGTTVLQNVIHPMT
jgi:hypothetical protein